MAFLGRELLTSDRPRLAIPPLTEAGMALAAIPGAAAELMEVKADLAKALRSWERHGDRATPCTDADLGKAEGLLREVAEWRLANLGERDPLTAESLFACGMFLARGRLSWGMPRVAWVEAAREAARVAVPYLRAAIRAGEAGGVDRSTLYSWRAELSGELFDLGDCAGAFSLFREMVSLVSGEPRSRQEDVAGLEAGFAGRVTDSEGWKVGGWVASGWRAPGLEGLPALGPELLAWVRDYYRKRLGALLRKGKPRGPEPERELSAAAQLAGAHARLGEAEEALLVLDRAEPWLGPPYDGAAAGGGRLANWAVPHSVYNWVNSAGGLAEARQAAGDPAGAVGMRRSILAARVALDGPSDMSVMHDAVRLGRTLVAAGKPEEAQDVFLRARKDCRRASAYVVFAFNIGQAEAQEALGDAAAARRFYRKLVRDAGKSGRRLSFQEELLVRAGLARTGGA
jgi:tetratricopeptide (TPR) repeat protein